MVTMSINLEDFRQSSRKTLEQKTENIFSIKHDPVSQRKHKKRTVNKVVFCADIMQTSHTHSAPLGMNYEASIYMCLLAISTAGKGQKM